MCLSPQIMPPMSPQPHHHPSSPPLPPFSTSPSAIFSHNAVDFTSIPFTSLSNPCEGTKHPSCIASNPPTAAGILEVMRRLKAGWWWFLPSLLSFSQVEKKNPQKNAPSDQPSQSCFNYLEPGPCLSTPKIKRISPSLLQLWEDRSFIKRMSNAEVLASSRL